MDKTRIEEIVKHLEYWEGLNNLYVDKPLRREIISALNELHDNPDHKLLPLTTRDSDILVMLHELSETLTVDEGARRYLLNHEQIDDLIEFLRELMSLRKIAHFTSDPSVINVSVSGINEDKIRQMVQRELLRILQEAAG